FPLLKIKASQRAWISSSTGSGAAWEKGGFLGKAVCAELVSFYLALSCHVALRGAGDANGGGAYVVPVSGRKSRRLPATLGTRLLASFGCVFAQFLQKPQQCQPFVF